MEKQDEFNPFIEGCRDIIRSALNSWWYEDGLPQKRESFIGNKVPVFDPVELRIERAAMVECDKFKNFSIREYMLDCFLFHNDFDYLLDLAMVIAHPIDDERLRVIPDNPLVTQEEIEKRQKVIEFLGKYPGFEYVLICKSYRTPTALRDLV